jgi:hypothetical protein
MKLFRTMLLFSLSLISGGAFASLVLPTVAAESQSLRLMTVDFSAVILLRDLSGLSKRVINARGNTLFFNQSSSIFTILGNVPERSGVAVEELVGFVEGSHEIKASSLEDNKSDSEGLILAIHEGKGEAVGLLVFT